MLSACCAHARFSIQGVLLRVWTFTDADPVSLSLGWWYWSGGAHLVGNMLFISMSIRQSCSVNREACLCQ
ncbi:hypothetical protein BRADI_3g13615v3 [Brachypodium distachyon]|uniref:Uncharacterized protein n=1 Tax=Brachypodium distachyon TaxID=15368 RepID=A0A2K2CWX3_BRADI|nr:hypothetical protein BRADI_3g13615v3 [Brachypodium distachyon]